MKDYSLDEKSYKGFILNYSVDNGQIIINMASGEKYTIPYSQENERTVLYKMEYQVLCADDFKKKQEERKTNAYFWIFLNTIILITLGVATAIGKTAITTSAVFFALHSIYTAYEVYRVIDSKKKLKDFAKNSMFLENVKMINSQIKSKKLDNIKKNLGINRDLTLNDMDNLSLKDINGIVDECNFRKNMDLDKKPHVLTKKRKKY